jgi:hypothetical protein
MASTYELWNTRTGNIIGAYDSEDAALEAVRRVIESYGRAYAERLLLGREDRHGRSRRIAASAELVERALADRPRPISA